MMDWDARSEGWMSRHKCRRAATRRNVGFGDGRRVAEARMIG